MTRNESTPTLSKSEVFYTNNGKLCGFVPYTGIITNYVANESDMAAFGKAAWEWAKLQEVFSGGFSVEMQELYHIAQEHGLTKLVEYDQDKHPDADAEAGDEIWEFVK